MSRAHDKALEAVRNIAPQDELREPQRVEFEMSQQQLDALLEAMKPVPLIMLQCGMPESLQSRANRAWRRLGDEMGFDGDTVRPNGRGDRFFTAIAKAANQKQALTGDGSSAGV